MSHQTSITTARRRWPAIPLVVLAAVTVVAFVLRWHFVDVQSGDYRAFVDPWYRRIATDGFSALGQEFANYNTPYLVLLWIATKLPLAEIVAVKLISVVFDLLLAGFVYLIVRQLRPGSTWAPTIATSIVLLLPTVLMNGAVWGQCDSIYGALCCGSLYFLLRRRPVWAAALFGIAFAFKLQALFFLPVLVVVLILNRHRLRALLAAPLAFAAMLVPAWLAGRSWASQLAVYPAQVSDSGGIGSGTSVGTGRQGGGTGGPNFGSGERGGLGDQGRFGGQGFGGGAQGGTASSSLTHNAPTPYAFLPSDASHAWTYAGLAVTALVVAGFGVWLLRRRRPLAGSEMVLVAAVSALIIPLLLPGMHERYFYLAEVLLVVAAFADRRFALPALALQAASTATYLAYLTEQSTVSLHVSAALALAAGVLGMVLLVLRLRHRLSGIPGLEGPRGTPTDEGPVSTPVRRKAAFTRPEGTRNDAMVSKRPPTAPLTSGTTHVS